MLTRRIPLHKTPPHPPRQAFDYAKKASFVIIWPSKESWYLVDRLTGALPFAMSAGTPIITSAAFGSVYDLTEMRGVIVAETVEGLLHEIVGVDDKGAPLMTTARLQTLIDRVYLYREQIRHQNLRTIDNMLSAIPGRTQVNPLALPNPIRRHYGDAA